MSVRLRAHHLLCMLTFVGEGYTPSFIANYRRIARRISAGETILLVDGPDDICAPLLAGPEPHCHRRGVAERDALAQEAVSSLLGRPVRTGSRIFPDAALLRRLRQAFRQGGGQNGRQDGGMRAACGGCAWSALCTRIADSGFAGALVKSSLMDVADRSVSLRKAGTGR